MRESGAACVQCADGRAPHGAQVDQIYHLACPASPVHYKYNPVKTIKARRVARCGGLARDACASLRRLTRPGGAQTNVLGTLNMLGLAKRVKVRRSAFPRSPPPSPIRF